MKVGDMVELAPQHANGFGSWAKKNAEGQLVRRVLDNGNVGCWRVEKGAQP